MASRAVKWISVFLSLLLSFCLVYMTLEDSREARRLEEENRRREREALPYEVELTATREALAGLDKQAKYTSAEAELMVGFVLTGPSDLPYIAELAERFGFTPILLIDCAENTEAAFEAILAADPAWETMLYLSELTSDSAAAVRTIRDRLVEGGRPDGGVLFTRIEQTREELLAVVRESGMAGYTVFSDLPRSGQASDGMIYFDYAFIRTDNANVGTRLYGCYMSRASMLFVFSMDSIRSGALSERFTDDVLSLLGEYAAQSDCRFATLSEVRTELGGILSFEAEYAAKAEAERARLEARIRELETVITAIYLS